MGRHGIDCEFERTGTIGVATQEYQVAGLRQAADRDGTAFLDTDADGVRVRLRALDAAGLGFDS